MDLRSQNLVVWPRQFDEFFSTAVYGVSDVSKNSSDDWEKSDYIAEDFNGN